MKKPSAVQQLILEMLSSREWVSSTNLLKATRQKYFDRRIRELRDELGYDIECEKQGSEPHYRLRSTKRKAPKPRTYLKPAEKKELLAASQNLCRLCGKTFAPKDLVLDHREPLIRGGNGLKENFQVVCTGCNNQKRGACKGCEKDCNTCFLAYPEKYEAEFHVLLDPKVLPKIQAKAKELGLDISEFINRLIKKNI